MPAAAVESVTRCKGFRFARIRAVAAPEGSPLPNHPLLQPAHWLFALPAAAVLPLLWASPDAGASDLARALPLLLSALGLALGLLYSRTRMLFLLLALFTAWWVLHGVVAAYRHDGVPGPHAPLLFHAVSLWLPVVFLVEGLWPERGRVRWEIVVRGLTLACVIGAFALLAWQNPDGMTGLLAARRWPWLPLEWTRLAQLPALAWLVAVLALAVQAVRRPRPLHTAMLLSLLCAWLMLPQVFRRPMALPVLTSAAMLLPVAAMLLESFHMAFRDELTGLPGRRALNEQMQRLEGTTCTIAMLDVDHFKKFNDTYGHEAGDHVLKLVASRLQRVGGGGRAYRYGGEEFAVVFIDRPASACMAPLEDLRAAVADARMQLRDKASRPHDDEAGRQRRGQGGGSGSVQVTISIGVADSRSVRGGPQAVIKAADQALYAAKDAGRNCVRRHMPSGASARAATDTDFGMPAR